VCWGREVSPKSTIFIFPLTTLHAFHMPMSHVTCNFTSTLLDKLSACVVSCWCTSHVACACENELVLLASLTKLPSPRTLHTNAICECMFCAHPPRAFPYTLNGIVVVSRVLCLHAFSI
jgi:hypothetical protein